MRRGARLAALLLVLLAPACLPYQSETGRTDEPITAAEMEASAATTPMDAVHRLRPHWLRRLNGVFLDNQRVPVRWLQEEPLVSIAEIRLVSADEATARFATRALSGNYLEVVLRER